MLNSKQRSNLKSIASELSPIGQIGKGGVTQNMIEGLADAIEKREIIKVSVLNNAEETPAFYGEQLAAALSAEVVAVIGKKIVLYKFSKKEGVKHLEF